MAKSYLLLLVATIVLASCGGNNGSGGGSSPAPTASLTASPSTITVGQNITLTWSSANADQGSVDNGVGAVGLNGNTHLQPTATTTYTYTATGPGGTATASATVTVNPPPPPTASLTATPSTITVGQHFALAWGSTNANQGSIDNGVGAVGINGSTTQLEPTATTKYTYTATGPGGTATASATVTVNPLPPPTATLTITPAVTLPGQPVVISWSSTNADSGNLDPGFGAVGPTGVAGRSPTATTIYTFTATGGGGTATATATVTVNPVTSFDGLKQSDGVVNLDVDPNGAVGTKQFMEYVNTAFQAYDKVTGQAVWSTPQQIETLWPYGSNCNAATLNPVIQLDVQILFDRVASRWLVGAKTSDANLGYYLCLAVSNTDDLSSPTLAWTSISSAKLDPILGSNGTHTYFPDWPKFGTWTDASEQQSAYYATIDLLDIDNANAEVGAVVCAFDRTDILNNPTNIKTEACVNVSTLDSSMMSFGIFLAHSLIPSDIDSTTLPPSGRDQFMLSIQNPVNDGLTLTSDRINLWDFHVDWTVNPATITYGVAPLTVPIYTPGCYLYDPNNAAITNCIQEPQNNGQQLIDSVGDRLMPRLAYQNFGSYESFLISHTVQTGPGASGTGATAYQTGVRWYELRGSGTPTLYQSGTINPDAAISRFVPSIAQDKMGDAAVGYSTSNGQNNPGIDFSYWSLPNATDPSEIGIIDGPGEEVSGANGVGKWGTYSSMTVDPVDGCTFWYVNEYFAADNTWLTRIANFQIPGCQ